MNVAILGVGRGMNDSGVRPRSLKALRQIGGRSPIWRTVKRFAAAGNEDSMLALAFVAYAMTSFPTAS